MAVANTVKFLKDLSSLVVQAIGLMKSKNYWAAFGMASQLVAIIQEAKDALPELQHLDDEDAASVCAAAYSAIAAIVEAA